MLRLSNIHLGIKLAFMSGLGVLLVAAMIVTQIMDNANESGLMFGLAAIVVLITLAMYSAMAVARPLGKVANALNALTNDRIVDVPYTNRSDEIGAIAKATEVFKQSVADKMINLRVRTALDTCQTNVMVADENYNIIYMNETMLEMLRGNEAELRKELPALDTNNLIGTCIDVFHKNPAHQRGILDKMTTTVRTSITVAGLTFDLVVTPTLDRHGKRTGTVVEWQDVTKTRAVEEEAHRVRTALDTCQTNVMVADEHYNIIYMNQTMLEMLRGNEAELRKELPALDTKKLIGTCIDVFHKNPAYQRGILDKMTTTVRTSIKVAALTFDLVVTPTFDNNGKRTGTVVEWQDVTKRRELEEAAFRVRSALDTCQTNVMVADEDYNIIYMNETMMGMMQSNEANLRKVLPNLDTKKLIGSCIDVFHKNPAHQRGILDKLTATIQTDLELAGLNFHLVVSPIVDKDGKRLGTTVEWKDETAEKAVEREINSIVQAAVAGDFSQRVPIEGKKGFMLNLANAMNGLCDNTGKALDDLAGMVGALADGDLTPRITAQYQGMFDKLKTDVNMMADRIGATIAEIKSSAREVTNASAEISTSTTDLSQRTEEQAASLEETSASMEEIASTVKKNAENAQEANQSASSTHEVADRGGQVVAKAVDAMAKIEESSRKISDIIGVIDEIARQTNLLALNAAVEAARAGDAGRGFAVVASEVRSLAQRSSQAAKDIKDLITNSNGQVKDGVELVNKAGTALTEIVESIKKVAGIVADIATASTEQATGIEQVNKALTQMDEVTQQNSALVEENAATAKTLEQQAKAMDERVAFFRLDNAAEGEHAVPPTEVHELRPAAAKPSKAPAAPPKQQRASLPPTRGPATKLNGGGGPVGHMHTALATAISNDPEWKDF